MSRIRFSRPTFFGGRKYGSSIGELYGVGKGEGLPTFVTLFALATAIAGGCFAHSHLMWLGVEPIGKTVRILLTIFATIVSGGVGVPLSFIALFLLGIGVIGGVVYGVGALLWHIS